MLAEVLSAAQSVAGVLWSRGRLYRLGSREDALQEAVCFALTLLRRRRDLRPQTAPAFMATAVRRYLLRLAAESGVVRVPLWARRAGCRQECRGGLARDQAGEALAERRDRWPDPDLARDLQAALPGEEAELLRRRFVDGLTLRQAAVVYGCSHEMVRRRELKALARCRQFIGEE